MWAKTKVGKETFEYEYCKQCEMDDLPHLHNGLCTSCYWKQYNDTDKRRAQDREYYYRNRQSLCYRRNKAKYIRKYGIDHPKTIKFLAKFTERGEPVKA